MYLFSSELRLCSFASGDGTTFASFANWSFQSVQCYKGRTHSRCSIGADKVVQFDGKLFSGRQVPFRAFGPDSRL